MRGLGLQISVVGEVLYAKFDGNIFPRVDRILQHSSGMAHASHFAPRALFLFFSEACFTR